MRNTTMVAVSAAAAAAAAAVTGGAASASTPDWLTLTAVDTGHDSLLPALCETGRADPLVTTVCGSVLSANTEDWAETYGYELPETPGGAGNAGLPALASVDLRNFAQWQICGNNVAASTEAGECDNSIAAPPEPTESRNGISLVKAETAGAFQ